MSGPSATGGRTRIDRSEACSFPPPTSPSSLPSSTWGNGCSIRMRGRGRPSWCWPATCSTRWWDWRFIFLLAASTIIAHVGAKILSRLDGTARRVALWATLCGLLGLLAWFKYYGFVAVNLDNLLHTVGLGRPMPLLNITLPVGISFFTFMAVSYVVDVYRRTLAAGTRHRRDRLPLLLPAPGRRAHRSGHRATPPDPSPPRSARRPIRRGLLVDPGRPGQEGGPLLLPVHLRRRPGLRRPSSALGPRGAVRRVRLRRADLRRLQRIHRHGHRPRPPDGVPVSAELPPAVHRNLLTGLLAALAHDTLVLAA